MLFIFVLSSKCLLLFDVAVISNLELNLKFNRVGLYEHIKTVFHKNLMQNTCFRVVFIRVSNINSYLCTINGLFLKRISNIWHYKKGYKKFYFSVYCILLGLI